MTVRFIGRYAVTQAALAIPLFRRRLVLGEALPDDAAVVLVSRRQQRHRPPLYWSNEFETPRISRHSLTAVAISGPSVPFRKAGTLDGAYFEDQGALLQLSVRAPDD